MHGTYKMLDKPAPPRARRTDGDARAPARANATTRGGSPPGGGGLTPCGAAPPARARTRCTLHHIAPRNVALRSASSSRACRRRTARCVSSCASSSACRNDVPHKDRVSQQLGSNCQWRLELRLQRRLACVPPPLLSRKLADDRRHAVDLRVHVRGEEREPVGMTCRIRSGLSTTKSNCQ